MDTITLVVAIIILAVLMWLVPVDDFLKKLIYVVALVCVLLWVLGMFGIVTPVGFGSLRR